MLFCQVWIARRATTSNLTKPQTFPLEKPRGSYSGLRSSLVFWMSLYKDYLLCATSCCTLQTTRIPDVNTTKLILLDSLLQEGKVTGIQIVFI